MSIPRIFYTLLNTQWRKFFKTNGPREWAEIRFTGFRETPSSLDLYGCWSGITNTGDNYCTLVRIDTTGEWRFTSKESRGNWQRAKQAEAKKSIETFLDPKCRCRAGFHWKCNVHGGWCN